MNTTARISAVIACSALASCAALKPVGVPIEIEHISHVSQHFGSAQTDYGVNIASVGLHWQPAPHLNVIIMEGIALSREYTTTDGEKSCGALWGGKEVFTARIGYEVPIP